MQKFAYEARDDEGQLTGGLITADSLEQAGELLSQRNLFVVRLGADHASTAGTTDQPEAHRGAASRAQVAWCMSQLSIMVETGIRLSDALEYLARTASEPRLKALLQQVSQHVHEGRALSDAMAQFPHAFPSSLTAMIRASEMSGTMTHVLQRSAAYLMNELQVIKRIRGAMMYPVFMFLICVSVTVFLLTVILPRFAEIFASRGATLPLPTRMLMGLSESLIAGWYVWLGGSVLIVVGGWMWFRTPLGRRQRDYLVLNLPVLSTVFNTLYQSRSFRTLSVLLNAGVSLLDAIKIVQEVVPNVYYRDLWREVDSHIQHGERLAGPLLNSERIPEPVAHMIDTGDRAGRLGLVFSRLADFIEQEYDQAIRSATQFIEPCMILCMGSIIGFVAASLMLPMFQASQVIAN